MRTRRIVLAVGCVVLGVVALTAPEGARATGPASVPACVSAVVVHREHTEGNDGITRDVSYRERFHRCHDRVWIERIVRPGAVHAPHGGDRHAVPELHTLARLVVQGAGGKATLALVDVPGKRVIDVDRGSFETLRFEPSFARAAQLVGSDSIATSTALARPSNVPGAEWMGRESGERYFRFLWAPKREIALAIESGTRDGTMRDEIRVEVIDTPTSYPWQQLEGFTHVDFADFGD